MRENQDDRPQVIGDPVTEVRPGYQLEPDAVRLMLTAPSFPTLLDLLGIRGIDQEELLALIPAVTADDEILSEVTRGANLLRAGAGLTVPTPALDQEQKAWNDLQERIVPGQGLIAILAHVVGTDVVRAWHRARGVDEATSWASLADLGQQMVVHRRVFGELGLHTVSWTAMNWTGRLFWLGRLQIDLHRTTVLDGATSEQPGRWVLGLHIPATGPLTPASVDESLARMSAFAREHFADLDHEGYPPFGTDYECHSWMINHELATMLGADSNLGHFARRWDVKNTWDAEKDAVFFVFSKRPPYEVAELPRDSRLRDGLVERFLDGRGWLGGAGHMRRA